MWFNGFLLFLDNQITASLVPIFHFGTRNSKLNSCSLADLPMPHSYFGLSTRFHAFLVEALNYSIAAVSKSGIPKHSIIGAVNVGTAST